MSAVVKGNKPLTDKTPLKVGKFYSVLLKNGIKYNGSLVFLDANEIHIVENEKEKLIIPRNEVVKIKKYDTLKSILIPSGIITTAAFIGALILPKEKVLH